MRYGRDSLSWRNDTIELVLLPSELAVLAFILELLSYIVIQLANGLMPRLGEHVGKDRVVETDSPSCKGAKEAYTQG